MNNISVFDGVVLIILGAFFLRSFFRGALKELISLVAIFSAYLTTSSLSHVLENVVRVSFGSEWMIKTGSQTAVFIVVWIGVSLVGRLVVHLTGNSSMGIFNRLIAASIGVGKGVFFLAVVYAVGLSLAPHLIPEKQAGNRVLPYIRQAGNFVQRAYRLNLRGQAELVKIAIGSVLSR